MFESSSNFGQWMLVDSDVEPDPEELISLNAFPPPLLQNAPLG